MITLSPEQPESRWGEFEELDVSLRSLGLSRMRGLFAGKRELCKQVEMISPDVIHSQGVRADLLSGRLVENILRICTLRNFPQIDYPMTYGLARGKVMAHSHIRGLRKLDRVISVSKGVRDNYVRCARAKNTAIIYNGVDNVIYSAVGAMKKCQLREMLKLPPEAVIWISTGHLCNRKNPILLIDAWKSAFGGGRENLLLFVGGGELRKSCEARAADMSNIRFLGRVDNVAEYLAASDYFVSPSRAEGLPNSVLEALACGLPVLLSDIRPHREILEMDDRVGRSFSDGDLENLRKELRCIRGDDYAAMRNAALNLVSERLSAKKMSEEYQRTYASLLLGGA